jgi:hypothetical protein
MNQAISNEWISPRATFEASRTGLALARRVGHPGFVMNSTFNAVGTGIHLGEWTWAASVLADLLERDLDAADRALGAAVLVTFDAVRGEPHDEALQLVRAMDTTESAVRILVHVADAYDAMSAGRYAEALRDFSIEDWSGAAFDNVSWGVHLASWTRDRETLSAVQASPRARGRHGPIADAMNLTIDAAMAALAGSTADALSLYGRALSAWRTSEMRLQEALTGIDMATLLDPALPDVQAAVARSRAILTELGAKPFLERLEAVTAGTGPSAAAPSPADAVPMAESEVTAG